MHLLNLMLVQCTRPCGPRALDTSKFSARALDLSYCTRKSKCAFINLYIIIKKIKKDQISITILVILFLFDCKSLFSLHSVAMRLTEPVHEVLALGTCTTYILKRLQPGTHKIWIATCYVSFDKSCNKIHLKYSSQRVLFLHLSILNLTTGLTMPSALSNNSLHALFCCQIIELTTKPLVVFSDIKGPPGSSQI